MAQSSLSLGIEFGSTRIKGVLIDETCNPVASGSHEWENKLEDGYWTYSLKAIINGLQDCYKSLADDYLSKTGKPLTQIDSIGISGMMHGYLAFDKNDNLLVPFRTWRNTTTAMAAKELTSLFNFNIPQRWSIAHLYQAILNNEPHVDKIDYITTLAGFVHELLTGKRVLGVGEASGMFPIDSVTGDYNQDMIDKFNSALCVKELHFTLRELLPQVLPAGVDAGALTQEGAKLLDPSGTLKSGALFCPPEGDAGTGMVATNSIVPTTGNVSAGTSIFAMVVLQKQLSKLYEEIDMVTTPNGHPVAMVHCNNCTSDLNAWANLLVEFSGGQMTKGQVLDKIFEQALKGDKDCGGLLSYNYFSGEPITGFESGRPVFARETEAEFTFANFARVHLYSALATLKIGMDILADENVSVTKLFGHGGFFKSQKSGQTMMAAAINAPISVLKTASEGGAWGMSLLARYRLENEMSLEEFLETRVFANSPVTTVEPDKEDVNGFNKFMKRYSDGLSIEKSAVETLK